MKFENTDDHVAHYRERHAITTPSPYETRQQAAADVSDVYDKARRAPRRGVMAEANLARLAGACKHAGVTLGTFDTRILEWLAGWEPETCAVIVGLITRAHAAGLSATGSAAPRPDPYCQAGQHANCPGRLCECPECQHWLGPL